MWTLEGTQVPSKIIYIISLMNTTEKEEPHSTWIQAHTLYSDWGEIHLGGYEVNSYDGLLFLA